MTENDDWSNRPAHERQVRLHNQLTGRAGSDERIIDFGLPMIEVFLIMRDGRMETETHVNDPTTLAETVAMSMSRTRARWAVYPDGDKWALTGKGKTRHYPTREAAEMLAIHRG